MCPHTTLLYMCPHTILDYWIYTAVLMDMLRAGYIRAEYIRAEYMCLPVTCHLPYQLSVNSGYVLYITYITVQMCTLLLDILRAEFAGTCHCQTAT